MLICGGGWQLTLELDKIVEIENESSRESVRGRSCSGGSYISPIKYKRNEIGSQKIAGLIILKWYNIAKMWHIYYE